MNKEELLRFLKQLDAEDCQLIGQEIAQSLPNAVGLLEGVAMTFVRKQCPNIYEIRHAHMSGFGSVVTTRLIHCISGLRSLERGAVSGSHKLTVEEQAMASIPGGKPGQMT